MPNRLQNMILRQKAEIVDRWFERLLATYPAETARFLGGQDDRFQNPIGSTIKPALGEIVAALAAGDRELLRAPIDAIIRIRAVQSFAPSEAVGFLFALKEILAERLGDAGASASASAATADETVEAAADLDRLSADIDAAALLAFDVYMECREQVLTLKANEIRRRTARLLRYQDEVEADRPDGPRRSRPRPPERGRDPEA